MLVIRETTKRFAPLPTSTRRRGEEQSLRGAGPENREVA